MNHRFHRFSQENYRRPRSDGIPVGRRRGRKEFKGLKGSKVQRFNGLRVRGLHFGVWEEETFVFILSKPVSHSSYVISYRSMFILSISAKIGW